MVMSEIDGVTTYYVGGYYELKVEGTSETEIKYYYAASRRIAMRTGGVLNWLFSDHLSSTTIITDESGTIVSEMKYTAFGEVRSENGVSPTDYTYTGQRFEVEFGLSYYNARWLDSSTAHFIQADSLIPQPGNAGDWDRYAYVLWNPIRYTDSTGHWIDPEDPGAPPEVKSYHPDEKAIREYLGRRRVAKNGLSMNLQKNNYYLWGIQNQVSGVNIGEPPYPTLHNENTVAYFTNFDNGETIPININEQTGNRIPIVCTDVPYLAYLYSGILLNPDAYSYTAFDTGYDASQGSVWSETATMRGVSSIGDYFNLSQYVGQKIEAGDVINFGNAHVGLVVNVVDAYNPDEIYILHTSERMASLNIDSLSILITAFPEVHIEVGVYKAWDD